MHVLPRQVGDERPPDAWEAAILSDGRCGKPRRTSAEAGFPGAIRRVAARSAVLRVPGHRRGRETARPGAAFQVVGVAAARAASAA